MRTRQRRAPGAIEQGDVKSAPHRQLGASRADDAGAADEENSHGCLPVLPNRITLCERAWSRLVLDMYSSRSFSRRRFDPGRVVHVRAHILIEHGPIMHSSSRITNQENSAAGLSGIIFETNQQDTVPVKNFLSRGQLQNVLLPVLVLRPAKPATNRPPERQCALDLLKLRLSQASGHVPGFDPDRK